MKDTEAGPVGSRAGWTRVRLSEVCQFKPPKSIPRKALDENDSVSFVPMNDLGELTKYFQPTMVKPLGEVIKSYTYFADGDVLCAKITPCFENGKLGIAQNLANRTGFGSSEFVVMRSGAKLLPEFLYYFLYRDEFREAGTRVMSGAVGHKRVPKEYFEDLEVPLPPLEEQKRIVAILDQAFAALDRARAHAEANLADAGELFGSSLAAAFFAEGDVPTKPLGSLCEFEGGSQPPKSQFVDTPRPGYIRLLQIRDFKSDEKAVYIPDDGKRRRCTADDIMIGRYGASVGQIHRGKAGAYNVALIKTIPNNEELNRDYFYYYLLSDLFQKPLLAKSSRGAQDGFNKADISPFSVPVPSILDQLRIVERLSSVEQEVSTLTKQYEEKLNDIADLRQSLLQKAFSGQLNA